MDPKRDMWVSKTRFYKMLCLLNNRLLERGVDISLPRYWYIYGDVACEPVLPEVYGKRDKSDMSVRYPTRQSFEVVNNLEDEKDSNVDYVSSEIEDLVDDSSGKRTEELVDAVYGYAPLDFIKDFNRFRKVVGLNFDEAEGRYLVGESSIDFEQADYLLDNMYAGFDELLLLNPERYTSFEEVFLDWEDTIRLAVELQNAKAVADLAGRFWAAFCRKFRLDDNDNIPHDMLHAWKKDEQESDVRFGKYLARVRRDLYSVSDYRSYGELEGLGAEYTETNLLLLD